MTKIIILQTEEKTLTYKSVEAMLLDRDNNLSLTAKWLRELKSQQGNIINYKEFKIFFTVAKGMSDLKEKPNE